MEHARPPSELCMDGSVVSRADAWKRWKTQFELFLKASGVYKEEAAVQASLLINLIGPDGFDVYQTFTFENDKERDDVTTLLKKYDKYFGVKPNVTLARYNFFTRNQDDGESIDQYVTALKLLSKSCAFSSLGEELIRDRIVCGIRSTVVRDRLLRSDDLTLEKAVKICQAEEVSLDSSRRLDMSGANVTGPGPSRIDVVDVRGGGGAWRGNRQARRGRGGGGAGAGGDGASSSQQQRSYSASRVQCRNCGMHCAPRMCPAFRSKCYRCQNFGHFARMCNSNTGNIKKMFEIGACEKDSDDDSETFYISVMNNVTKADRSADNWYETLRGECSTERFKLDTGADMNVISYGTFLSLGYDSNIIREKHNIRLLSYGGDVIPIRGVCHLKWWYKNKMFILKFAVADISCESVLGRETCNAMGMIKRIHGVNLSEYDDLMRGLGCLPGIYHIVVDESIKPVICASRKVPLSLRDKLHDELNKMIDLGVIRKVSHPTPWVNALVIVAKKNGGLRLCLDPRPLNCAIKRAHFQLPTLGDIAAKLHGAQYFSVLDANSGFWAIKIDDQSADLCTFSTPFGRYQFLRLPYGLNCAPEVFHAKMKQLVEDLEGVDCFVDDLICWGKTRSEHDQRLSALLNRAREINLKFNRNKCKICVEEVTFLGHVFNKNGMQPDTDKIRAIEEMPPPTDKKSLERFLGAINYISKFIPNYSEHIYPLTRLLKKDYNWSWELGHKQAFETLKKLVCSAPVLALYDVSRPVTLSVDASSVALGAVLMQAGRPVEYASRTLTGTQARYAQIEKELLAIVFACEKFHQYIFGKKDVVVETDHKPLESIFKKPLESVPVRLQRMLLRIQGYDLIVNYKPGKYMYIPDALSRAPLPDLYDDSLQENIKYQVNLLISCIQMSPNKLNTVKEETAKDDDLCLLIKYINNGWPDHKSNVCESLKSYWSYRQELCYIDGLVLKNNLILIPHSLRNQMLSIIHDGHLGMDRCKRRAREVLFWPGITKDVELYVKRCKICQECSNAPSREPMIPIEIPSLPWNKVGTDIFEYKKKYYILLVDYYSGFIEVASLSNISSNSVIKVLKENFARYGIPQTVISDNGTQFSSRDFKRFAFEWGFEHVTSSPNYPQSNGKSERAVQTIKKILIKSINSDTDFYLNLLSFRNTPRDNLSSPAQSFLGRRLNCRLPVHPTLLKPVNVSQEHYNTMVNKQEKIKLYYDTHTKKLPELSVGDDVIMIDKDSKMRGKVLMKSSTPRSYIVQNRRGMRYRRNRRHLIRCEPEQIESPIIKQMLSDCEDKSAGSSVESDRSEEQRFTSASKVENEYNAPVTRSKTKLLKTIDDLF